jgi:hypothetical protein
MASPFSLNLVLLIAVIRGRQTLAGAQATSFYGFDGHGSVRCVTGSTGAFTDTYDYDAFASLISSPRRTISSSLENSSIPRWGIYQ